MNKMLFTAAELRELATPYPDLILQSLRNRNQTAAIRFCEEMQASQIVLHDFFAHSCTVLWSWIGESFGEKSLDEMFRYVFEQSARRQFFDAACAEASPHLAVILLARSWRAHSCFGAGDHPGKFSVSEDEEKFTFRLDPCGSGLRLWRKGFYNDPKNGRISEKARPWTYNRKGFPYYCIHCPFLNEILPCESSYGSIMWPVDPPGGPDDVCCWHIYKDRNDIPESYYARVGIAKPVLRKNKYLTDTGRYFSDGDLVEMARPTTEKLIEQLRENDFSNAAILAEQLKDEFLVLHDLYVNMLVATFSFVMEKSGDEGLEKALQRQYSSCVREPLIGKIRFLDAKNKVIFLARHIFGTDLCCGRGRHTGRMKIFETDDEIIFVLNPCGSGGRLLRAGGYEKMPGHQKLKERIENLGIETICRLLKFPERLLEFMFPVFVTHFTQRKPFGQERVKRSHAWSFDRAGTPVFCCQCGMIHETFSRKGLDIISPKMPDDKCIWRISKQLLAGTENNCP